MTPHDHHEIARHLAEELRKTPCQLSGNCTTFDENTVEAIKDAARAYKNMRSFLWWAGAIMGTVFLGSMAAGFLYVLKLGFVSAHDAQFRPAPFYPAAEPSAYIQTDSRKPAKASP